VSSPTFSSAASSRRDRSRPGSLVAGFTLSVAVCVHPVEAQAAGQLKAVRVGTHGDHTRVVLDLHARVDYRMGQLSAPERLYLDLFDTRPGPALRGGRIAIDDGLVRLIRIGQPQPAVTRVVLDLSEAADPNVFWTDTPPRLVVDLMRVAVARNGPTPAPSTSRTAPPSPPTASPPSAPETTGEPLSGSRPPEPQPPGSAAAARAPGPSQPRTPPASFKAAEPSRTLWIPRVTRPPELSDFLQGMPREAEARVDDFLQRTPGDGVPVSQPTMAYLSYDDNNLYAVFLCVTDPRRLGAHMAKREGIGDDDRVTIFLDTFQDHRRAYVFSANALGIQQDAVSTEGQPDDPRFDTAWHAQGRVIANGYVVWMAIPFRSLRFSDRPVQTWGIALGRTIPRKNETAFWPHISRRGLGFIAQMGTLTGIERISPPRNVQLAPYAAATRARLLGSGASFSTTDDARGGLDAKVVLRNAVSFDATLNPDFSQVESDDPQVTINQRFEVFFPEKRPFFIENSGFFQTPINLFFSRRIVDPEFGGRLTGKMGPWALGALAADDRAADRQLSAADPLRGRRAGITAFRLQRELGRQSTIGVLATTRAFGAGLNQVVAVDSRLKLGPNWSLTGQVARSYQRGRDGQWLDGTASYAELQHGGRHFTYLGSYTDRSPGFRSEVGFINRVDVRRTDHYGGYFWQPERSSVLSVGPSVSAGANWDRQGRLQDWYAASNFGMDLAGPTGFTVSRYDAYELYLGTGFRHFTTGASFYTGLLRWLSISGSYYQGTSINYSPPAALFPFLGNAATSAAAITLRPTSRLRLDQTYFFSRLATRPGSPPPGGPESAVIFRNQLLRTKINYQFSKALSIRAILDYNATLANPALITQTPFKRLSGDVLVTYLTQPGTAIYVGYADRYDSVVVDPTTPPTLRVTGSPQTSTARQFFIKVSYLFHY
jgi:hypothetical protein